MGDFDSRELKALIERYFGPIPAGPRVERPPASLTTPLREVTRVTIEDPVAKVPRLVLAWSGVTPFSQDEAAGQVLAWILGQGSASRLHQAAVVNAQVASAVTVTSQPRTLGGTFEIAATATLEKSAGDQLAPIQQVLDAVKAQGPTQVEVDRAVRGLVAHHVRWIERAINRADLLNEYEMYVGDPGYLGKDLARYRAVTPAAVQAFARKYLADEARLELTQLPKGAQ